jgi:hypothetical protein
MKPFKLTMAQLHLHNHEILLSVLKELEIYLLRLNWSLFNSANSSHIYTQLRAVTLSCHLTWPAPRQQLSPDSHQDNHIKSTILKKVGYVYSDILSSSVKKGSKRGHPYYGTRKWGIIWKVGLATLFREVLHKTAEPTKPCAQLSLTSGQQMVS